MGSIGNVEQSYDTPYGTSIMSITASWMEIGVSYFMLSLSPGTNLAATLSLGVTRFSRDATMVTAGALGAIEIAPAHDTSMHYAAGLSFNHSLTRNLLLNIEPALRLITPLSSSQPSYSISGGIILEVL